MNLANVLVILQNLLRHDIERSLHTGRVVLREDLESCIYYTLIDLVEFDTEFGEGGNGKRRRREWDRVGAFD